MRSPVRRADEGLPFAHSLRNLRGDAEIGQLDVAIFRQQNVGAFDVTMDFAFGVEVAQAFQRLSTHVRDFRLHQRARHVIDILAGWVTRFRFKDSSN